MASNDPPPPKDPPPKGTNQQSPNGDDQLPQPSHFSLPIHTIISTSQNSHGLRHDDYAQYRAYCTRRLSRLRHAKPVRRELSFSSVGADKKLQSGGGGGGKKGGRHAFHPRAVAPEDANRHVNYMTVALYSAERAWSHALELKGEYDDAKSSSNSSSRRKKTVGGGGGVGGGEKKRSSPGKIRNHYLRKLKKATEYAVELEKMAEAGAGDGRTVKEARAYGGWMRGNWGLEVGDWQMACTEYGTALSICRALGSGEEEDDDAATEKGTSDVSAQKGDDTPAAAAENLELRDFFTARASQVIEPLLRYCQYELRQEAGAGASGDADALHTIDAETEELLSGGSSQQLQAKLDARRDERLRTEASGGSMSTVHFRERDVPVENKNLRVALLKVEGLKSELEKHNRKKGKGAGGSWAAGGRGGGDDSKFLALLSGYDDATSIVSADLKEYRAMKSGPAVNAKRFEMESLLGYVKHQKLKLMMTRNERMVNDLRDAEQQTNKSGEGKDKKKSSASGGDVDSQGKRVEEIAHLYDALLQDARAVSNLPGGGSSADEVVEDEFVLEANANVLRLRALRCYYVARMYGSDGVEKYSEAVALFEQASSLASQAAEEIAACQDMENGDVLIESMEQLERDVAGAKCRAEACACLVRLGGAGAASSTSGRTLLRRLDDFDSGGSTHRLAQVPPSLEPIPCKPTFFDIALNDVGELPLEELQKEIEANKPQSKGLLGWFRRG